MSTVGYVGFSVNGEWLTSFIKEQFFHEGRDFDWVIQTISAMFKGANDLDDERIEQIAQDVILGRSWFKGETGKDFVFCDGRDEPISSDFFRKFSTLKANLKKEREARVAAQEAWQEIALLYKGEIERSDLMCEENIELFKPMPTEEYINRMIAPEEEVAPYGFISPDGEFHPVPWADHEEFAEQYIHKHGGWEVVLNDDTYDTAKDVLIMRLGWLLLHNPRQGNPVLTQGERTMTKAQREALFDYYTKYGMKKEASALYQEVEA